MGEGLISRGFSGNNAALVKISTYPNAPITISNKENSNKKIETYSDNNGYIEINLEYGKWKISTIDITNNEVYKINVQELTIDKSQIYNVFLKDIYSFGISIDMSISDPSDAITYFDSAEGIEPLSVNLDTGACNYGGWEEIITNIFGCKPCCCPAGQEESMSPIYLNPNNYSEPLNANVDINELHKILSNNHESLIGNVMVEFKRTWYKYSVNGNILTFEVANYDRSEDGFVCSAFKSMDGSMTVKDYMYYAAYEGYYDGESMRSIPGVECYNNSSFTPSKFKELASYFKSYGMEDWCKKCYILGLLMLVTKTRDLQSALGYGHIINEDPENGDYIFLKSGSMDSNGLFFGRRANKLYTSNEVFGVKVFGIENLWGNFGSYFNGIDYNFVTGLYFTDCPPHDTTGNADFVSYSQRLADINNKFSCPTSMITVNNGAAIFPSVGQADISIGWTDWVDIGISGGLHVIYALTPLITVWEYKNDRQTSENEIGPFSIEVHTGGGMIHKSFKEYVTARLVAAADHNQYLT